MKSAVKTRCRVYRTETGEPEYRNEIGSQNTLLGVPDRIGEPEYRNEIGGSKKTTRGTGMKIAIEGRFRGL